jgi:hypothetical protein
MSMRTHVVGHAGNHPQPDIHRRATPLRSIISRKGGG